MIISRIFQNNNSEKAVELSGIHLYHIAYSNDTLREVHRDFLLLNNTNSNRSDWREYWPIRNFLLNEALVEDDFYGFFSPRFKEKTLLDASDVKSFIQESDAKSDVIIFSPQPDMSAFFLNVFQQAEYFDPGFIECSESFFKKISWSVDINSLVMDSRQTVFSNYFVAKPCFWRAWLALNEQIFAICEGGNSELKDVLTKETAYPGSVQRKVFLMERMASTLLAVEDKWKVRAFNTFKMPFSDSHFSKFPFEAVVCDALKIAMKEQDFFHYQDAFKNLQKMVGLQINDKNDS